MKINLPYNFEFYSVISNFKQRYFSYFSNMLLKRILILESLKTKKYFYILLSLENISNNNFNSYNRRVGNLIRKNLLTKVTQNFRVANILFFIRSKKNNKFTLVPKYVPLEGFSESIATISSNVKNILFYNDKLYSFSNCSAFIYITDSNYIIQAKELCFIKKSLNFNLNHYITKVLVNKYELKILLNIKV